MRNPRRAPAPKTRRPLAVIFDLDGLLADTETLHAQSYIATLAEVGVPLSEEEYAEHWIRSGNTLAGLLAVRHLTFDPATLRHRKAVLYDALVRSSAQPMPGARQALDRLAPHKRLALASSSYRSSIQIVLETLGFARYFETSVSGEEVERVKPAPDLFLQAARNLGLPAGDCAVIEDAEKGLRAALAAGMPCVVVPNRFTAHNDFSGARVRLDSLDSLDLDLLEKLY